MAITVPTGATVAEEDSEAAALWIVETCRRWSAGVASVPSLDTAASPVGDPPGRARQQQQQLGTAEVMGISRGICRILRDSMILMVNLRYFMAGWW